MEAYLMLLGAPELHKIIDAGYLNAPHEHTNAASIDIRIGNNANTQSVMCH